MFSIARVKYDLALMKFISTFEARTGAHVKDAFVDNDTGMLLFIIQPGEMGKAIGKQGKNARLMERVFNRKIKIVEFDSDVLSFINNLIFPLKVKGSRLEEATAVLEGGDTKTKSLLIGRDGRNLKRLTEQVKRFFPIASISVV